MKILICAGIFPPEIGGPATYAKQLAEAFAERGHEVTVITYSNDVIANEVKQSHGTRIASSQAPRNDDHGVIRITRSRFKPWHYFKYYQAVKKHGKDVDVLFAQGPVSEGYPAYLANRFLKKPFVVKITGDYSWEQARARGLTDKMIEEFQSSLPYPKTIRKMRELQKIVCENSDLVITPSEYLKKIVAGWGIEENKIRVIYNAIEIPDNNLNSPNSPTPLFNQRGGKGGVQEGRGGEFLIVSAGRNVPWKGFEVLKQAVDELSNSMPVRRSASEGGELDTKIRLEILQDLNRAELLTKLKSADLFVLNSGYEGFAHSVLEAMASGVPVITTNVGGNAEIITPLLEGGSEANGILVEYNNKEQLKDAIMKLYQNPELRQELIENGKKTAEKFSLEKMIGETENILNSYIRTDSYFVKP